MQISYMLKSCINMSNVILQQFNTTGLKVDVKEKIVHQENKNTEVIIRLGKTPGKTLFLALVLSVCPQGARGQWIKHITLCGAGREKMQEHLSSAPSN